jgi:hypothetical protein
MMRQSFQQIWPARGHQGLSPSPIRGIAPLKAGATALGTRPAPFYRGRTMEVVVWRQRAPRVPFRQRVAGWRARNWRRAVLAWFVLSLIVMAASAEPASYFPKAQARSVPAVGMVLHVAGGLTAAGVPVILIALP